MHPQDTIQLEIQDLRKQIQETRMEIRTQSNRIDGLWWKIGLMAGVVAIMVSEVFGQGIGSIFSTLIGVFPL